MCVCVEYIFGFCFKPDQIFLDPIIYPFLYHFFCEQKLCIMMMMIMIPKTIFFLRKFLNKKKIFSLFDLDIYLVYMAIIIIVIITIVCVCVCRIFIFFFPLNDDHDDDGATCWPLNFLLLWMDGFFFIWNMIVIRLKFKNCKKK